MHFKKKEKKELTSIELKLLAARYLMRFESGLCWSTRGQSLLSLRRSCVVCVLIMVLSLQLGLSGVFHFKRTFFCAFYRR